MSSVAIYSVEPPQVPAAHDPPVLSHAESTAASLISESTPVNLPAEAAEVAHGPEHRAWKVSYSVCLIIQIHMCFTLNKGSFSRKHWLR